MAASCVPRKGVNDYSVRFLVGVMRDLGFKRMVAKSENEHAIIALREAVTAVARDLEIVPQGPPVGDHPANGFIESCVREVKRQCRVVRTSSEEKLQDRFPDTHDALTWLPRYAANLISRYRVGLEGKTPDQRRCGRRWRKPSVQFFEEVFV